MSGPVRGQDVVPADDDPVDAPSAIERIPAVRVAVGGQAVHRTLPRRRRRTIGPWCLVDHLGPADVGPGHAFDVAPHPHVGLQTVTWLLDGEVVHHDSLGSEQVVRPGQLNLMTAGHGVVHAELGTTTASGRLHGVQLWLAQPETTRHGPAAFEHHATLPRLDLGTADATVLVGHLATATSPARRDTDHVGVDLVLRPGTTTLPLDPAHEHAVVVLAGTVAVAAPGTSGGGPTATDELAHVPPGPAELALTTAADARLLVLGGTPFEAPVLMWWNYVARTRAEIDAAHVAWRDADPRFGTVAVDLPRIPGPPPPWAATRA